MKLLKSAHWNRNKQVPEPWKEIVDNSNRRIACFGPLWVWSPGPRSVQPKCALRMPEDSLCTLYQPDYRTPLTNHSSYRLSLHSFATLVWLRHRAKEGVDWSLNGFDSISNVDEIKTESIDASPRSVRSKKENELSTSYIWPNLLVRCRTVDNPP